MKPFELHLPTEWRSAAGGNLFRLAGQLLEVAKIELTSAGAKLDLPTREVVLAAAAAAYDKYIAPIDIAFVPNLIEPLVDAQLKKLFIDAVGRIYDAINKPAPTPDPAPTPTA